MEIIIENLGLLGHKNIIIEFLSLLTGNWIHIKELGEKIGIYEKDFETFKALFEFILVTTKYDMQIKPKIISEIGGISNLKKDNEVIYKEFIDPIKATLDHCIMILIRTGAVDVRIIKDKNKYSTMKKLIGDAFKNIAGEDSNDPIFQKNVNSSLSKEKLVEICEIMIDDVRILSK